MKYYEENTRDTQKPGARNGMYLVLRNTIGTEQRFRLRRKLEVRIVI